ncbi:MAG: DUF4124 domain-containing protein [Desulfuromonadaceae bacterium]|nr:DUF4124 domain-containing protein [Desulfuromonadaceae bacterium]MDD2848951.1 DUF4124 domain-containing protein [Desulfuromonadaceae bacterium]MDD4130300.1 DUF4124 domain-containing protein [Desulfuromonadaceae bacterium]
MLSTFSIAGAEIYQWVDGHGVVTFKDTPPPASKKYKNVKTYNDSDFAPEPPRQAVPRGQSDHRTGGPESHLKSENSFDEEDFKKRGQQNLLKGQQEVLKGKADMEEWSKKTRQKNEEMIKKHVEENRSKPNNPTQMEKNLANIRRNDPSWRYNDRTGMRR